MKAYYIFAAMLLVVNTSASARISDGWSGKLSVSGSETEGNTNTKDLGLGIKIEKQDDLWQHKLETTFDYGQSDKIETKERFYTSYQLNRKINKQIYGYGNINYFDDKFGSYTEGYFTGGGMGYRLVSADPVNWDLEGGAGYRSQKSPTDFGTIKGEITLRVASNFDWQLSESVSLNNDLEITTGESDNYVWTETGLTAKLVGNLAARASFRIDHHSDVPNGTRKRDKITRLGVVYTME